MKTLSIIIPMYNSEKFIEKCIQSLLITKEVFDKLDIIVVNDGSIDKSRVIVENYVKQYPNCITLLNKKNGGHGSAINAGARVCKGKYIKVLDADDWLDKQELEKLVLKLEKYDVDLAVTNYKTYHIIKHDYAIHKGPQKEESILSMQDVLMQWAQLKNIFCIHCLIFNTCYYKSLHKQLPEGVFYDDAYYYTVLACFAKRILILPEIVTIYRIGDVSQSVSTESRIKRIEQHKTVIRAIVDEKEEVEKFSSEAREYWLRKLETTVCDYYVTTLLRFQNRKEGRILSKEMKEYLYKEDYVLEARLKKRYRILLSLYYLHLKEHYFEWLVSSRLYKIMSKG